MISIKNKGRNGFTLVELLIVVAIIAILAALSVFGMQGAFEGQRDAQRKSDLKQYQTALENFANKNNGIYPIYTSADLPTTVCAELYGAGSTCPDDPRRSKDPANWNTYRYYSDAAGLIYLLTSRLENFSTDTFWVVCSNGRSGTRLTAPTNATCPF